MCRTGVRVVPETNTATVQTREVFVLYKQHSHLYASTTSRCKQGSFILLFWRSSPQNFPLPAHLCLHLWHLHKSSVSKISRRRKRINPLSLGSLLRLTPDPI